MSGQRHHPHISDAAFTPFQHLIPTLPPNTDGYIDSLLASPPLQPRLQGMDIDENNLQQSQATATTMEFTQEKFMQLQALADRQAKMLEDGNVFQNEAARKLQDSQRQLEETQRNLTDLTAAFNSLSTQGRPLTVTSAPKKKPDLPAFDSKNVLVWIRRVEAAYRRAGVIDPKDKFAWMESIFQVKLDPQIDAYLYGENTNQDWDDFISYLKKQYGPTIRQKAQKLLGDIPRHDLKPSQWLLQLKDDTKDVELDHILREHLLKTIPSRIREIMGKEVEEMSSEEVAKMADTFFDRQGKPTEKQSASINNVMASSTASATPSPPRTSSSTPFTQAFSDDDDGDINHVRGGRFPGNGGNRSNNNRGPRSKSRSNFTRAPTSSSTTSSSNNSQTKQAGLCRWHRRFGDKALKCLSDCSRHSAFLASQNSGNGQGGRRQ